MRSNCTLYRSNHWRRGAFSLSLSHTHSLVFASLAHRWRTWDVHPDEAHADPASYLALTSVVQPHPRLFFSMKHQAWDYWRYVKFNPTIGIGGHGQVSGSTE